MVNELHPGLMESNKELMFRVLCRQFVEMISGYDKLEEDCENQRGKHCMNGVAMDTDEKISEEEVEDVPAPVNFDSNPGKVEKLLAFGRELQHIFTQLTQDCPNRQLQSLLQDSFSLLAYTDPRSSPVSYLLEPSQREPVAAGLNSAILKANGLPGKPALEFALGQSSQCLNLMLLHGVGAAAFANVKDLLKPSLHHKTLQ